MPMPLWWGQINKRIFNPMELRRGVRPVLRHAGRSSGAVYRTPLDAHRVEGGFVFIPVYGPECDWVQNVLAAGTATLEIEGEVIDLEAPRLLPAADALQQLPASVKPPPGWLRIGVLLRMDLAA